MSENNQQLQTMPQDLQTKRQYLYYLMSLNVARLDYQLMPLIHEVDQMPVTLRAVINGMFTMFEKTQGLDLRTHPSAMLLLMLHILPDDIFDKLWDDYKVFFTYVNHIQSRAGTGPTDVNVGENGERKDTV